MGKLSRKQLEEIAPIGNSPTYMTFADMVKVRLIIIPVLFPCMWYACAQRYLQACAAVHVA